MNTQEACLAVIVIILIGIIIYLAKRKNLCLIEVAGGPGDDFFKEYINQTDELINCLILRNKDTRLRKFYTDRFGTEHVGADMFFDKNNAFIICNPKNNHKIEKIEKNSIRFEFLMKKTDYELLKKGEIKTANLTLRRDTHIVKNNGTIKQYFICYEFEYDFETKKGFGRCYSSYYSF